MDGAALVAYRCSTTMRQRFIEVLIPFVLVLAVVVVVRVYPVAVLRGCARVLGGIGMEEQEWRIRIKAAVLEREIEVKRCFPDEELVWVALPSSHLDQALSEYTRLVPAGLVTGLFPRELNPFEVCVPVRYRDAFTVEALEAARRDMESGFER